MTNETSSLQLTDRFLFPRLPAWLRFDTDHSPVRVARRVGRALGVAWKQVQPEDDEATGASFTGELIGHRLTLQAAPRPQCRSGRQSTPAWQIVLEIRPAVTPDQDEDEVRIVNVYIADFMAALIVHRTGYQFQVASCHRTL